MIRINLLPHREERRKSLRQQFYGFSAVIAVVAGLVWFVGFTYINTLIDSQNEKNDYLKNEISTLDAQIAEIKKLKEQTDSLLARKQVIESLQANRTETVHLFNELARLLPPGIYLSGIKQEQQKVTLTGYSQSNARVSALMQNLDDSPVLERPVLVEIKAVTLGKRRTNEFNLYIHFTRQTTEEPVKGAPGKQGAGKGGKA